MLPRDMLAQLLLAQNDLAGAEQAYSGLKTVAREDPQAYLALGRFYRATGQLDKAVAEFRSLTTSNPNDSSIKVELIETLVDLDRLDEALALKRRAFGGRCREPEGPSGQRPHIDRAQRVRGSA